MLIHPAKPQDDKLRIRSAQEAVARAQALVRKYTNKKDMVDSFIAENRQEAAREMEEITS